MLGVAVGLTCQYGLMDRIWGVHVLVVRVGF